MNPWWLILHPEFYLIEKALNNIKMISSNINYVSKEKIIGLMKSQGLTYEDLREKYPGYKLREAIKLHFNILYHKSIQEMCYECLYLLLTGEGTPEFVKTLAREEGLYPLPVDIKIPYKLREVLE